MSPFSANLPAVDSYRNQAILSTSDFGTTWTPLGNFPEVTVKGIAADPANPGTLLATGKNGIWKTSDSGAHWYRVLAYPAPNDLATGDIAYDPAVRGHVLTVGYDSVDGGESWIPFGSPSATQWGPFAFDPKGNGVVMEGGIDGYRSTDGGRTWNYVPSPGPTHSFAFDALRPGVVYGLGSSLGVYVSADDGATFAVRSVPFQYPDCTGCPDGAASLFADAGHPGRIYVITGSGVMYRSDDVANSWQKVYSGTSAYGASLVRTCSALALGNANGAPLLRSLDDGDTWQAVAAAPVYLLSAGAGCTLFGASPATQNGYVAKYSPGGDTLLWGSYVSGDWPFSVVTSLAVTADGSLAVGGLSKLGAGNDGWATKLDSAGHAIFSKTFGSGSDSVAATAIDSTGAVWLAGTTSSTNFPVTSDAFQSNLAGGSDAFLVKLDPAGTLAYATYLGMGQDDAAASLAVDSRDRVIVGGSSASRRTIMLVRFDQAANRVDRFTEPGSSSISEGVDGIAIGADDSIYATGTTLNNLFPVAGPAFANPLNSSPAPSNAFRQTPGDRFLLRLNPDDLTPIYSRRFGAQCASSASTGLQVRPDGTAVVAAAYDETFPQRAEIAIRGLRQLAEVSPDGSSLMFSSPVLCCDEGSRSAPTAAFGPRVAAMGLCQR